MKKALRYCKFRNALCVYELFDSIFHLFSHISYFTSVSNVCVCDISYVRGDAIFRRGVCRGILRKSV